MRLVERGVGFGGEAAALAVADVRLGRLERPPVGGHLEPLGFDHDEILVDVVRACVHQQLLDDHLGHRVLALAEVVEPDASLGVGEVDRGPEVVGERLPDAVLAVDRDRVLDAQRARPGS